MILDTATPIEWFFLIIGLFFLAVNGWGLRLAYRDTCYVAERRRGSPEYAILLLVAGQQLRNEIIRTIKQIMWLGVYVVWLLLPSPIHGTMELLLITTATAVAINQILLAFATVMDRLDNVRAQRLARRRPTVDLRMGGKTNGDQ